jgi:hypothetical protein
MFAFRRIGVDLTSAFLTLPQARKINGVHNTQTAPPAALYSPVIPG